MRKRYGLESRAPSKSKIIAIPEMERDQQKALELSNNPKALIENAHWQDILDKMKSDVVFSGSLEIIMLYNEADIIKEELRSKGMIGESSGIDINVLYKEVDDIINKYMNDIFPKPALGGLN